MTRPRILLSGLILMAATGCQSSQFSADPFLIRQRVPPPGTGVAPPAAGQPYYQTQPPVVQPGVLSPITPAPAGSIPYNGAYGTPQSSSGPAKAVQPGENEYLTGPSSIARRSPVIQARGDAVYLDDASPNLVASPVGESPAGGAATLPPPSQPTESAIAIVEPNFPAARADRIPTATSAGDSGVIHASARGQSPASADPAVVHASSQATFVAAENSLRGSPATAPTAATDLAGRTTSPDRTAAPSENRRTPERFSYSPDYGRLQGRLEFLSSRNEWKLRYIPIDGVTDQYGGSVVIANPDSLGSLRAGDFVVLQGQLEPASSDSLSFAPPYRVSHAAANGS